MESSNRLLNSSWRQFLACCDTKIRDKNVLIEGEYFEYDI